MSDNNALGTLYHFGVRVYEDINCLEETAQPVREHKIKPWHLMQFYKRANSKSKKIFLYHDRIQKKWIKRWGYVMKPVIFKNGSGDFICHPTLAARLKAEFRV